MWELSLEPKEIGNVWAQWFGANRLGGKYKEIAYFSNIFHTVTMVELIRSFSYLYLSELSETTENAIGWKVSWPIMVAARFKARTISARSHTGVVGSNPTLGMDVCLRLLCVCVR